MDQTWTAVFCVTLAFLSGANSVTLLIGRVGGVLYLHDTETHASRMLLNGTHISAVDYHYSRGYVYYSNFQTILSRKSVDPNINDVVKIAPHKDVYGIAVDWVNNNLYWTRSDVGIVEKADLHGNDPTTIISKENLVHLKDLHNIVDLFGIEVDPFERMLFMVAGRDWQYNGTLIRSDLEGRNISPIANNKYKFASFFSINREEKKLYVAVRGQQVVYSCNYNGELIEEFSVCPNIGYIFPLAVFRQKVYMMEKFDTDYKLLVETLPKMKCLSESLKSDSFRYYGKVYAIKVYGADMQQPIHGYNRYQRIKQRFSNWDKCSLLSTEWERFDCLDIAPMGAFHKNSTGVSTRMSSTTTALSGQQPKTTPTGATTDAIDNQRKVFNLFLFSKINTCSDSRGSKKDIPPYQIIEP